MQNQTPLVVEPPPRDGSARGSAHDENRRQTDDERPENESCCGARHGAEADALAPPGTDRMGQHRPDDDRDHDRQREREGESDEVRPLPALRLKLAWAVRRRSHGTQRSHAAPLCEVRTQSFLEFVAPVVGSNAWPTVAVIALLKRPIAGRLTGGAIKLLKPWLLVVTASV